MNRLTGISLLLTAVALTCSVANAQTDKKLKRNQLPPAVEKTVAAEESAGATVRGFAKEVENKKTFYEAELTVNGHNKDMLIDRAGKIVEVEEQVDLATLPATVQDAIKRIAGTGTIELIEAVTKNGKLTGYEGRIKRGNKTSGFSLGPNGEKPKKP